MLHGKDEGGWVTRSIYNLEMSVTTNCSCCIIFMRMLTHCNTFACWIRLCSNRHESFTPEDNFFHSFSCGFFYPRMRNWSDSCDSLFTIESTKPNIKLHNRCTIFNNAVCWRLPTNQPLFESVITVTFCHAQLWHNRQQPFIFRLQVTSFTAEHCSQKGRPRDVPFNGSFNPLLLYYIPSQVTYYLLARDSR